MLENADRVPLGTVGVLVVVPVLNFNQLKFPTYPADEFASNFNRSVYRPADSEIPPLLTVVHRCQPPVFGTLIRPVLSAPFTSTWNAPPENCDATRASSVYVPLVFTSTVYSSHSPAFTSPTLNPPPLSVVDSMSTSVDRCFPPWFPPLESHQLTFCPPLSKFSACTVPGSATGVPPNGLCVPEGVGVGTGVGVIVDGTAAPLRLYARSIAAATSSRLNVSRLIES